LGSIRDLLGHFVHALLGSSSTTRKDGVPMSALPATQNDFDVLLTERQAADHISVTTRAMQKWRLNGKGPKFVRISGRCIRYRKHDLFNWINDRIKNSTSEA